MHRTASSPDKQGRASQRRLSPGLRAVLCFTGSFAATALPGADSLSTAAWLANGLLLSYLLLAPRRRWKAYLPAGFAGQLAGCTFVDPGQAGPALAVCLLNLLQVTVAAWLLRGRTGQLPAFTSRPYVLRFLGYGVLLAPAVTGLLFAFICQTWLRQPWEPELRDWIITDALGIAVGVPSLVAILRARLSGLPREWDRRALLLLILVAVPLLMLQDLLPMRSLVFPLLVLILLRLNLGWAALCSLLVGEIGRMVSVRTSAATNLILRLETVGPTLRMQLFIASAIFTLYAISVVLQNLRATQKRLEEIAFLHELVTRNSRDFIIVADFHGRRSYVSTSATAYGGWTRGELLKISSMELLHPEDRVRAAELVNQMQQGLDGGLLECRVREKAGNYVWVEASLRTIYDPVTGAPNGILNMVRDISKRKHAEQELQAAYRAVEEMAVIDVLTGIPNRRRFEECLAVEWRRALREREPLSLVLLDVDLFKSYNDTYGHVRGDSCLKQVAEAAMDVVTRPGDLVARFGGEEFAIVLPNTSHRGALAIAEEVRAELAHRSLPHDASPHGTVSVSAGCATIIPGPGQRAIDLVELADCALYRAKRLGRNCVAGNPDQALIPETQGASHTAG